MKQRRKVQVVVFRRKPRLQFLLLKYVKGHGGFWQNMTGNVKSGESIQHAFKRELFEETGISREDIKRTFNGIYSFEYIKNGALFREKVFAVMVRPTTIVDLSKNPDQEHDKFEWFSLSSAKRLIKWPSNKHALDAVRKALRY